MANEWECEECGHIHVGERAPRRCPECEAADSFILLFEDWDGGEEKEEEPGGVE